MPRALVLMLKSLAQKYGVDLVLNRDSSDDEVRTAYRKVALKSHPDKGGEQQDFQRLSAQNGGWQNLLRRRSSVGRPSRPPSERPKSGKATGSYTVVLPTKEQHQQVFRVQSQAALFTSQKFQRSKGLAVWERFSYGSCCAIYADGVCGTGSPLLRQMTTGPTTST